MHVELSWHTRSCSGLARPRHATLPGRLLQRTCGSDLSLLLFLTLSSISTMQVSIKDLVTRDVLGQVVVEQESSVAFLKHRLWELQPESFPRCRQCLYDGDMELEDAHVLEDYGLQLPDEHTIHYKEVWYEPYCPGCSDCQQNFCTACNFYPINRGILWPEPRPYCLVCNQGPAPAAEPPIAAAHSDTSQDSDSLVSDSPEAPAPASTIAPVQPAADDTSEVEARLYDQRMLFSDIHLNERVHTSDGTIITRPYESLSSPRDQRMLWSDILMNQAETAQGWWRLILYVAFLTLYHSDVVEVERGVCMQTEQACLL